MRPNTMLSPRFIFRAAAVVVAAALAAASPRTLLAQRGGGMGGGMGGMGGSRGGGGGRGRTGSTNNAKNGTAAVKDDLKKNDLIAFILDHKKPIKITDQQADTLKAYRKEMLYMQEPVFKDMDKVLTDARQGAVAARGGAGAAGSGAPLAADTVRSLIARLNDIQDAYRDRAKLKLSATQIHVADSLQTAIMAEERDKEAKSSRPR